MQTKFVSWFWKFGNLALEISFKEILRTLYINPRPLNCKRLSLRIDIYCLCCITSITLRCMFCYCVIDLPTEQSRQSTFSLVLNTQ